MSPARRTFIDQPPSLDDRDDEAVIPEGHVDNPHRIAVPPDAYVHLVEGMRVEIPGEAFPAIDTPAVDDAVHVGPYGDDGSSFVPATVSAVDADAGTVTLTPV